MTKATNKAPALDWTVFLLSGGILVAFVLIAFLNLDSVSAAVNAGFTFSTRYFGAFWQFLLFANFAVSIGLAVSRYGSLRLGGEKPEMSTFRWISIFMCTVLAAGGVFWCFAEPMYHFTSVPPNFTGITSGTSAAVAGAGAELSPLGFSTLGDLRNAGHDCSDVPALSPRIAAQTQKSAVSDLGGSIQ